MIILEGGSIQTRVESKFERCWKESRSTGHIHYYYYYGSRLNIDSLYLYRSV